VRLLDLRVWSAYRISLCRKVSVGTGREVRLYDGLSGKGRNMATSARILKKIDEQ